MADLSFARFYILLTVAILALGAMLSAYIVFPLRLIARSVKAMGVSSLSARIGLKRKDEIGALARAYDEMSGRLEQSFARERQLLQDVSHELRAPLARMNFSVRLARTAPDRALAMDEVKRDLDRLSYLVSELTELSIGPLGGPEPRLHLTSLDLQTVLSDVLQECQPQTSARSCRIAFSVASTPTLQGDIEHLRRAFGNVLRNAIRHSPPGSEVHVTLGSSNGSAVVQIEDSGSGVPPDQLQRIFDPFFQVDPSRAAADAGLGLGLSIAKRSVEMHHGRIWAENSSPGLRVTIELPYNPASRVA